MYYYLHYHHVEPCRRNVEYALHYSYCANSTIELAAGPTPFAGPAGALPGPNHRNNNINDNDGNSSNDHHHHQQLQLAQQPCGELTYAPEYYNAVGGGGVGIGVGVGGVGGEGTSYSENGNDNNPCATGGCLVSQHCSSGGCRLEDLGGRWTCCKCQRGGNTYRWCVHPMKKVPDTLCYHVVCQGCRADT